MKFVTKSTILDLSVHKAPRAFIHNDKFGRNEWSQCFHSEDQKK